MRIRTCSPRGRMACERGHTVSASLRPSSIEEGLSPTRCESRYQVAPLLSEPGHNMCRPTMRLPSPKPLMTSSITSSLLPRRLLLLTARAFSIAEELPQTIAPQAYRSHQSNDLLAHARMLRGPIEGAGDRRLLPSRMSVSLFYEDSWTKHTCSHSSERWHIGQLPVYANSQNDVCLSPRCSGHWRRSRAW